MSHRLRLNVRGEKGQALLAIRKIRNRLTKAGAQIIRGEFVRCDQRLYLDVDSPRDWVPADFVQELRGAELQIELLAEGEPVDECVSCGNIPDAPFAVCPNCEFEEIEGCPQCQTQSPRTSYPQVTNDIYRCPVCSTKVRLRYNEPMWTEEGYYRQPLIQVIRATE